MSLKRRWRTENDSRKHRRHKEDQAPLLNATHSAAQQASAGGCAFENDDSKAIEQWVSEMDRKKLMASSSLTKHARNLAIRYSKTSMSNSWLCFKNLLRKQFMPLNLVDETSEESMLLKEKCVSVPTYSNKFPRKLVQMKEIDANIQEEIHKSAVISNVRVLKFREDVAAAGHKRCNEVLKSKNEAHVEAEYDEYASVNSNAAVFCRSAALILMALLLLRHALAMAATGADKDPSIAGASTESIRKERQLEAMKAALGLSDIKEGADALR